MPFLIYGFGAAPAPWRGAEGDDSLMFLGLASSHKWELSEGNHEGEGHGKGEGAAPRFS